MRLPLVSLCALLLISTGCYRPVTPPPEPQQSEHPQIPSAPAPPHRQAEVSYDTRHDGQFAEYVAKTAGDMVQKVAVGIERRGVMRIQLGAMASPDDTLPLTKSLLAGARKDFPDKPITVSVYDPKGEPILKASYQPDRGVHYEVVHSQPGERSSDRSASAETSPSATSAALPTSGTTEKDRQFAAWAMQTGQRYLRYVQADLEHRGRLWLGVTQETKPEDVTELTRSLLQGAHTEFPQRELTATVFDPEGERIGKATLTVSGRLRWSQ